MTPNPHTVDIRHSVAQAIDLMRDHRIRHLPVLSNGAVVGVVSERDITFGLALNRKLMIADFFTAAPYTVEPDTPLADVAERMAEDRLGCALIVETGKVVGIFTSTDACRVLARELRS